MQLCFSRVVHFIMVAHSLEILHATCQARLDHSDAIEGSKPSMCLEEPAGSSGVTLVVLLSTLRV